MIENIVFTANTVAPVFLMIALGYFIKKVRVINENFVEITSKFVFSVSLPALVFMQLSSLDLTKVIDLKQIGYVYIGTIASYLLTWFISIPFIKDGKDRSVFVQGAYRSNYAIVGLSIIFSLFGDEGLGKASLILAFILPLYNVLAVIVLTVPLRKEKKHNIKAILLEILFNPLIVAVLVSLPFSFYKIKLPAMLMSTGNFLADVALPLALIGIGGSLNFKNLKRASALAFSSSAIKLVIVPLVLTAGAFYLGYTQLDLGIMFVLFACPTAIVSFIMAEAMGANSKLAGNIVVITTIGSVFTIAIGIVILKGFSLI